MLTNYPATMSTFGSTRALVTGGNTTARRFEP